MRKPLVLILLAVLVIGGPAYYWYWSKRAEEFRQMFVQSVTAINENAKAVSPETTFIRYDAIEPAGFPFGMTLVMKKPVVDVPISAVLRKSPQVALATTARPDWVEEITYGDSVSVSGNITGNKYTLTAAGDRTDTALVNGAVHSKMTSSSASPLICHLAVEQTGTKPWVMQPIFTDMQTFLSIFRGVDCAVSGATLKDTATGTLLFSADKVAFAAGNDPQGVGNRKLFFTLDEDKAKATPAFDTLVGDLGTLVHQVMGVTDTPMAMIPFSAYGEQDAHIDMRYDGPSTPEAFADPAMKLHFDIKPFTFNNALFTMDFEAHAGTAPEGSDRNASVVMHDSAEVTEQYDTLLAKQVGAFLTTMKTRAGSVPGMAKQLDAMGPPDEVAAAILPKFHALGKQTFDIDVNAKGPGQTDAFLKQGTMALNALNWNVTPYGLQLKGNMKAGATAERKSPSGELTITCITCDALITDLGNYALRIETIADRMQPGHPPYVTHDLIEGFRQFIHGIAQAAGNSKDLVIDIVMKDTGEFTVSGKQLLEVVGLFGTTVAVHLPQAVPPAANAPMPEPTQPVPALPVPQRMAPAAR